MSGIQWVKMSGRSLTASCDITDGVDMERVLSVGVCSVESLQLNTQLHPFAVILKFNNTIIEYSKWSLAMYYDDLYNL